MRVTIVGCSGSFPGPDSAASCYLVEADHNGESFRIVLDLGSGALGSLQRYCPLESIDAVVLSHLHADHCLDLCAFYVVRRFHPDGAMGQLPVYGPEGTGDRIARAYDLPNESQMSNEFDFMPFPRGEFQIGPFSVSVAEVDHPVLAFAVKVSDGMRTLVYTGDTARCGSIERFAAGADVETAAVGRLVLTHVPPWHSPDVVLAEASPGFSGETTMAKPGATFEV
jgi:ribonuclease BN (tRNA processing enzyme)